MILFNIPLYTGVEDKYLKEVLSTRKLCGDGNFSRMCQKWFEEKLQVPKTLLTSSCTHALEIAAILINIQPGDEVIMPSYTFVSTANAFVLRGARIVFVDIRPDTMNIDETKIEKAITNKTKAIVPVHYAGVSCEMDEIMRLARKHNLYVIEDAAQGMMSTYKGKHLGSIGHIGAYSFHETKNYTSGGEGGLLIVNIEELALRAEIIREKGTNRSQYFRGMVDKYSWIDVGSSYLPSELQAAYLWGQLEIAETVNIDRLKKWNFYFQHLKRLAELTRIELPSIPAGINQNAHMFYIKVKDLNERTLLLEHLKQSEITAVFHYVPLHSSIAGQKYSIFHGKDSYTTSESEKLVRLPLYFNISEDSIKKIISEIYSFYGVAHD